VRDIFVPTVATTVELRFVTVLTSWVGTALIVATLGLGELIDWDPRRYASVDNPDHVKAVWPTLT